MLEINQFVEFGAAVLRSLPRDLNPTTAQGWITDQRALADVLRKVLKPGSEWVAIHVSGAGALQPPYNGWESVEDATAPVGPLELELAEFLEAGENSVRGTEMRKRAKKSGPMLGERHARALLSQQECIPETWRKFFLVFPGTVWRDRDGCLRVPCLGWRGGGWDGGFKNISLRDNSGAAPRKNLKNRAWRGKVDSVGVSQANLASSRKTKKG